MRTLRFYVPLKLAVGKDYTLPEDKVRHIVQVLRLSVGAEIVLFNGDGFEYSATLFEVTKKQSRVTILTKSKLNQESPLKIHLIQGLSKGDRMDITIQKTVELGVNSIFPINTARSNVKLSGERIVKKGDHWGKVIQSACEQSGRNVLPELHEPSHFELAVGQYASTPMLKLILHPLANNRLSELSDEVGEVVLLVGPEGGFNEAELLLAEQSGFLGLSLGPRVLRTETAAMAMIAGLQAKWGDF